MFPVSYLILSVLIDKYQKKARPLSLKQFLNVTEIEVWTEHCHFTYSPRLFFLSPALPALANLIITSSEQNTSVYFLLSSLTTRNGFACLSFLFSRILIFILNLFLAEWDLMYARQTEGCVFSSYFFLLCSGWELSACAVWLYCPGCAVGNEIILILDGMVLDKFTSVHPVPLPAELIYLVILVF